MIRNAKSVIRIKLLKSFSTNGKQLKGREVLEWREHCRNKDGNVLWALPNPEACWELAPPLGTGIPSHPGGAGRAGVQTYVRGLLGLFR